MPSTSQEMTKVTKFGHTLFITFKDGTKVEALTSDALLRRIAEGDSALDLSPELELSQAAEQVILEHHS